MKEDFLDKYKNIRQLSWALAFYSSTSIFGPLLIIGGAGWYLDRVLGTRPWLLAISIFIAFIVTNILLFKKVVALTRWISRQKELRKKDEAGKTVGLGEENAKDIF
ncbi:MAG: AtpZ/AtpI family protein [Patescibacteria group bacterium]|nr:AtpZ/AtpI family protein [Patescibacteria group bacterium]